MAYEKFEVYRKDYIKGLFARTKFYWIENVEKLTKYFLNLKTMSNKTCMLALDNGIVTFQLDC